MGLTQTVGPDVEPVSLADAKSHMRVTTTDENDLITALIVAARFHIEAATGRQMITASWEWSLPCFPSHDTFAVPLPPLQSVTHIKYTDSNGDEQTLADTVYDVDIVSRRGRIGLAYGQSWPSIRNDMNAVRITFVAGYGDAASDIPANLIHAHKLLIEHLDRFRGVVAEGRRVTSVPTGLANLIHPFINSEQFNE